ncbi:hypothetical protein TeGR_g930 [Tetraparma gracilis]|uniref:Uncharacterized protein n=1 Tax=Tetraparma gracilis TaxID=2962635 RepID=A0ABQ6M5R8_9STRA|nr:hypothetical protein TeGR_g930 [Tetraparma gracilis]
MARLLQGLWLLGGLNLAAGFACTSNQLALYMTMYDSGEDGYRQSKFVFNEWSGYPSGALVDPDNSDTDGVFTGTVANSALNGKNADSLCLTADKCYVLDLDMSSTPSSHLASQPPQAGYIINGASADQTTGPNPDIISLQPGPVLLTGGMNTANSGSDPTSTPPEVMFCVSDCPEGQEFTLIEETSDTPLLEVTSTNMCSPCGAGS